MNRNEFMRQLEALLQNISPAEREEALQYYNDYFDDAGTENEQDVIEALGNPARVAENIKRDLYGSGYGDNAYQSVSAEDKAMIPYGQEVDRETAGNEPADNSHGIVSGGQNDELHREEVLQHSSYTGTNTSDKKLSGGMIALIVILCVLASPFVLSIASGLVGVIIGIAAFWFALIFGFGVTALALAVVFLVLAGVGISCMLADPLVGVALIGGGMLCGGLGILFLMLAVAMAGIATPAICSGIAGLMKKLFRARSTTCA